MLPLPAYSFPEHALIHSGGIVCFYTQTNGFVYCPPRVPDGILALFRKIPISYRIPLTHVQGKACGAKKTEIRGGLRQFSFLQPPKAAKASVKPLSKRSVRAAMAVICLTARDTARRVWMRSAPTGPSKPDVFPRGDTFRRASYRQFFVMHSAIWIFSRVSEQIKQSFCENLYGACRGTPGLRIVFAWVFRYNKYRCCLHKGYLQKA